MTTTLEETYAALQAEIAALRQSDEDRAARVRRIEALQLPVADEAVQLLSTKPMAEAVTLLAPLAEHLTDNLQNALHSLVQHAGYVQNVLDSERARIRQQVEADAQAEQPSA